MNKTELSLLLSELSLLLFFETCAVDQSGRIAYDHMNTEDRLIAERWNESGFVRFGRICSADAMPLFTHWCQLSDEAWTVVHAERKARALRLWANRNYQTTEEWRESL